MDEPEESPRSARVNRNILVGIVTLVVLLAVYFGGRALRPAGPPERAGEATPQEQPAPAQPATLGPEVAPAPAPAASEPSPSSPRRRKAPGPEKPVEQATAPTSGTLHIDSDVPGAFVFLDRQFVGKAPVTAEGVAPGSHQLNVSAEGYEGYSQALEVAPGPSDVMVRFKEVKLHETVAVVHKHRFGSCEGRLVATTQGIRYETAHEEDQFLVPFSNLEVFEVNYLDKNLKIKVRGGRTYNFTDRNPNADALYVFHRNVEKVRARLGKEEGR